MKLKQKMLLSLLLVFSVFSETIILSNSGSGNVCKDTYIEETINSSFYEGKALEMEVGT